METPTDDGVDDLGYGPEEGETPPAKEAAPAAEAVKPENEKPVEKPATGYGAEEPKEVTPPAAPATPPVEKKPEEMTEEEKVQKELADVVKDLGAGYDKEKIQKFASEHKLTKVQLEAYVKMVKQDDETAIANQKAAVVAQRKAWREELVKDPEFGGENFAKNVDRVEKLLENNMSNTKKMLTEKGGVLPPYLMRDLLSLAKALNPTTKLVHGEAPAPQADDKDFLDDLYT